MCRPATRPLSSSSTSRPTLEWAMRSSRLALWRTSMAFGLALAAAHARGESDMDLAGPSRSWQDVLGLSGSVRASVFSKDKSFSDTTGYAVGAIWAPATPQEVWGIKTYFGGPGEGQDLNGDSDVSRVD